MKELKLSLQCFESLDSTNTYLKAAARDGAAEGTVIVADAQTAGRGRMGRHFLSLPGRGVYMSVLLRPDCAADCVQSLTAATAVAVCRAIEKTCKLEPEIKWVNDLYLNGRKICGILCESSASADGLDFVVLGIGLNVLSLPEDFPPELRDIAGSIYSQSGMVFERGALIAAILGEIAAMYPVWCERPEAYLREYKRRCKMLGRAVSFVSAEGEHQAVAEDVSEDYGLIVRFDDGSRKLLKSGEISVKL